MACPRCGCRIISKLGKGHAGQLICADCGLDLTARLALQRNGGKIKDVKSNPFHRFAVPLPQGGRNCSEPIAPPLGELSAQLTEGVLGERP
jgi:hypothetical protein